MQATSNDIAGLAFLQQNAASQIQSQIHKATKDGRLFPPPKKDYIEDLAETVSIEKANHSPMDLQNWFVSDKKEIIKQQIVQAVQVSTKQWVLENIDPVISELALGTYDAVILSIEKLASSLAKVIVAFKDDGPTIIKFFSFINDAQYVQQALEALDEDLSNGVKTLMMKFDEFCNKSDLMPRSEEGGKQTMLLYFRLQEFVELETVKGVLMSNGDPFKMFQYQNWFKNALRQWIAMWELISKSYVSNSLQNKLTLEPTHETSNIAEEAVIAMQVLAQGVIVEWKRLSLQDVHESVQSLIEVTEICTTCSKDFSRTLHDMLMQRYDDFDFEHLLRAANSVWYVGDFVNNKIPDTLHFEATTAQLKHPGDHQGAEDAKDKLSKLVRKNGTVSGPPDQLVIFAGCSMNVEDIPSEIEDYAQALLLKALAKMLPEMQKHTVASMTYSNEGTIMRTLRNRMSRYNSHSCQIYVEKSVKYLEDHLMPDFYPHAFNEFYSLMMKQFETNLTLKKQATYYLPVLEHVEGFRTFMMDYGVRIKPKVDQRVNDSIDYIRYRATPTRKLICDYYHEHAKSSMNGITAQSDSSVTCKVGFVDRDHEKVALVVQVMRAKNLPPKDDSGTLDPFVKVSPLPRCLYSSSEYPSQKTAVIKRNQNPVYSDAIFKWSFPLDGFTTHGATLGFAMWDYDHATLNDFAGEAYIHISKAVALDKEENIANVPETELLLLKPEDGPLEKFIALRERIKFDDKARSFVLRRLALIKDQEAVKMAEKVPRYYSYSWHLPIRVVLSNYRDTVAKRLRYLFKNCHCVKSNSTICVKSSADDKEQVYLESE